MILKLIISRGIILQKGVTVPILYTLSDAAYICTKFHENILDGINVIEQIFIRNISKGHNFTKIVGGVSFLVLCTLSDTSLFLYPVP